MSPKISASGRASCSARAPRSRLCFATTVRFSGSRSTTRGLPVFVSPSMISAPSPATRTIPADRLYQQGDSRLGGELHVRVEAIRTRLLPLLRLGGQVPAARPRHEWDSRTATHEWL